MLDVVEGRSGAVLAGRLAYRAQQWRTGIGTTSSDPFRGYATALTCQLPEGCGYRTHSTVVKLGRGCVDDVRRRMQLETRGHRGRTCERQIAEVHAAAPDLDCDTPAPARAEPTRAGPSGRRGPTGGSMRRVGVSGAPASRGGRPPAGR